MEQVTRSGSYTDRRCASNKTHLRLASGEVQEVKRALLAAYVLLLRELNRVDGYRNREAGLELCERKWKLEALLRQLDHSDGPPAVLELVPAGSRGTSHSEAAERHLLSRRIPGG